MEHSSEHTNANALGASAEDSSGEIEAPGGTSEKLENFPSPRGDEITLTLPASPQYVRVARITASGLASRLGFSWEEVEDLRLAVDELYHAVLVSQDERLAIVITYWVSDESLEIEAKLRGGADLDFPIPPQLSEWAGYILAALVDEHGSREALGTTSLWVKKIRVGAV